MKCPVCKGETNIKLVQILQNQLGDMFYYIIFDCEHKSLYDQKEFGVLTSKGKKSTYKVIGK